MLRQLPMMVAAAGLLLGCSGKPTPLTSQDGRFEITVRNNMSPSNELNDEADIQAANLISELYVVVLSEAKTDFDEGTTLSEFDSAVRETLESAFSTAFSPPKSRKTDAGDDSLQSTGHAKVDGIEVGYLLTTVETGEHFHQILAWTLEEKFDSKQETLDKIAMSFKDLKPSVGSKSKAKPTDKEASDAAPSDE